MQVVDLLRQSDAAHFDLFTLDEADVEHASKDTQTETTSENFVMIENPIDVVKYNFQLINNSIDANMVAPAARLRAIIIEMSLMPSVQMNENTYLDIATPCLHHAPISGGDNELRAEVDDVFDIDVAAMTVAALIAFHDAVALFSCHAELCSEETAIDMYTHLLLRPGDAVELIADESAKLGISSILDSFREDVLERACDLTLS